MSLDGFVTARAVTAEQPMGREGARLHTWARDTPSPRNAELLEASVAEAGAFICGRRTYDLSLPWWGADGPTGPARVPLVVVTHDEPDDAPDDGVYTFVDGVADAVARAQQVAGARPIAVMSADIGRQCLLAGLVDEVSVHLVPVLLGDGTRLFEAVGGTAIELGVPGVVETAEVTHLRYPVRSSTASA